MSDSDTEEYEAAFREAIGQEPAGDIPRSDPEPEDEQAADDQQDEAAPEPPNTDPETNPTDAINWADAPDVYRTAFEAVRDERDRLEHQRKSDEGRVAAEQRKASELQRKIGALTTTAQQEDLKAYFESDGYKKAKEDYGDDLGPIFSLLEGLAKSTETATQTQGRIIDDRAHEVAREVEDWLNEAAPDRFDLFSRNDFKPWLDGQPKWLRDLAQRNWEGVVDPAEVVEVADRFRSHLGLSRPADKQSDPDPDPEPQTPVIDQKRAAQLDAAKSSKTKQPPIVADASEDDYAANFAIYAKKYERELASNRR